MKLTLNIIGKSLTDIKLGLEDFMREVKNENLESNCTGADNSKDVKYVFDYEFVDTDDIWETKDTDKLVNPYEKEE